MQTAQEHISQYNMDVWLIYGSFSYGLETAVWRMEENAVILEVTAEHCDSFEEVCNLLDSITETPKGLVRSILRLYVGEETTPLMSLSTDLSPILLPDRSNSQFKLKFSNIQGITPKDAECWQSMLTTVRQSY